MWSHEALDTVEYNIIIFDISWYTVALYIVMNTNNHLMWVDVVIYFLCGALQKLAGNALTMKCTLPAAFLH